MKIVTRYNHVEASVITDKHELINFNQREIDQAYLDAAQNCDLLLLITVDDYHATKHLLCKKIFLIITDDPNAWTWGVMDPLYADPLVKLVAASCAETLFHWRVPAHLSYLLPPATKLFDTRWKPEIKRIVCAVNELYGRPWHCGLEVVEYAGRFVPITLIGRCNESVRNVEIINELPHQELIETASRYYGALIPYRYSASPNWTREAMLLGMPVFSTCNPFSIRNRVLVYERFIDLVEAMIQCLDNPPGLNYEQIEYAKIAFNPSLRTRMFDAMVDSI